VYKRNTKKLKRAQQTLNRYLEKYNIDLDLECQRCGVREGETHPRTHKPAKILKIIENPEFPFSINLLCESCWNRILHQNPTPGIDQLEYLPDRKIKVKDMPSERESIAPTTARTILSRFRKKHAQALSNLHCFACGKPNHESKLQYHIPNYDEPYKVVPLCRSCIQKHRRDDTHYDPIDLEQYVQDNLVSESFKHQKDTTLEKTRTTTNFMFKIFQTPKPKLCSECLTPTNHPENMTIFYTEEGNPSEFYLICEDCMSANPPGFNEPWSSAVCNKLNELEDVPIPFTFNELRRHEMPRSVLNINLGLPEQYHITKNDIYQNTS